MVPRRMAIKPKELIAYFKECELLRAGNRVGVAVSGGADSVALLRLLIELQDQLGIVLSVVHFNHKLRGKASDGDESFVARLAENFGLTLHVGRGDVAMNTSGGSRKVNWLIAWRRRIRPTIRQRPCSHTFCAARGWRDWAEFIRQRRTALCARC